MKSLSFFKAFPFLLAACSSVQVGTEGDDDFVDPPDVDCMQDASVPSKDGGTDVFVSKDAGLDAVVDTGCNPSVDGSDIPPDASLDASDASDASDAEESDVYVPPPNPPYEFKNYDYNHILSTGQSNSVGNGSSPPLSNSQPYNNVMFNSGVMTCAACDGQGCRTYENPNSFVPLKEGDRFFSHYTVETMSSAMANQITFLYNNHVSLVSNSGRSGNVYKCLGKNSCNWFPQDLYEPFAEALQQVRDAKRIAEDQNKSYAVRAITSVHGESDQNANIFPQSNSNGSWAAQDVIRNYKEALFEWQRDFEKDIKQITGQQENIPLLISQISGWNNAKFSFVAQDQYLAQKEGNGKVLLVAPSYFLDFKNDCLHFSNKGTQWIGEYFAKVYERVIIKGEVWKPLMPNSLSYVGGNKFIINFHVPNPPLTFDTQRVAEIQNYGFELFDNNQAMQISSVKIVGNSVEIITSTAPTTQNVIINYAQNQNPGTCIGPNRGARGNLRDNDQTLSKLGYSLYNWSVLFSEKVSFQ